MRVLEAIQKNLRKFINSYWPVMTVILVVFFLVVIVSGCSTPFKFSASSPFFGSVAVDTVTIEKKIKETKKKLKHCRNRQCREELRKKMSLLQSKKNSLTK